MAEHATESPLLRAGAVDDCWRRIGVSGDRSCPQLATCIHCRNCPVHAHAAVALLDALGGGEAVDAATLEHEPAGHAAERARSRSCLVFRVDDEWLALPTAVLGEVTAPSPIHSLPHRRHAALLGVAPVRGALLPCMSLALLFGGERPRDAAPQARARFLILGQGRHAMALPVDEVAGVERIGDSALLPLPATLARASARYTEALFDQAGRVSGTVGLLDADLLRQALARSLA